MKDIIIQFASYITAIGVIIKAVDSIFDKKTTPIRKEVENTNKKIDNNEKDDLRYKILSFANSLHNGVSHTRQEYETIFMFYDKYEVIISELGIKNGYLETEMAFIRKTYEVKYMEVKNEKNV